MVLLNNDKNVSKNHLHHAALQSLKNHRLKSGVLILLK